MLEQVGSGLLAACLLACGFMAVSSKRLVHSVLWLALTLITTAVIYVVLHAPFLAGVQIILYTGGVITLMLFGVMLTDGTLDTGRDNPVHRRPLGLLVAAGVFGLIASAVGKTHLPKIPLGGAQSTKDIGASILGPHVLSLEVLSVLLLAAVVGAIVLARRSDP